MPLVLIPIIAGRGKPQTCDLCGKTQHLTPRQGKRRGWTMTPPMFLAPAYFAVVCSDHLRGGDPERN